MALEGLQIEPITGEHREAVLRILQAGVDAGATVESFATWEAWDAHYLPDQRFVALRDNHAVAGWAALSPVRSGCAHAGVVENSVFVDPHARRLGVGKALLRHIILSSEASGIWTIEASIFPENEASIKLHGGEGFIAQGVSKHRVKVNGIWRDVLHMERRSQVVGID